MEISITRALNEVKLLEKRIKDKIQNSEFVITNKNSNKKIHGIMSIEEFKNTAKSDYTSIIDLINRKKIIKSLIVESNARTKVTIADRKYTVADAIERKNSIELDKLLLSSMRKQYNNALLEVTNGNENVEDRLNQLLISMFSSDNKNSNEAMTVSTKYREDNCYKVIDCLNIKDKMERLEKDINDFENEVDFILSESNSLTKINIPE